MKTDTVYLRHIIDAITKIESYACVGKEEFISTVFRGEILQS